MLGHWLLLLLTSSPVLGSPDGAPLSACRDMLPRHGCWQPQETKSPFTLKASASKVVLGRTVTVTLSGGEFLGYILQALNAETNKTVGIFTEVPFDSKAIDCGKEKRNAVTHRDSLPKIGVAMIWKASGKLPVGMTLIFRATVLRNFQTFWTNVDSQRIKIIRK